MTFLPILALIVLAVLVRSVKVVQEYERAVIFRLGRSKGAKGPGLFFIVPFIDKIIRTNLQVKAVPVAPQQVITKDNVTTLVDAVAYFQVVDPEASVIKVDGWYNASQLVAQTTLRAIIGRHELDQLLSERDRIDTELRDALDGQTHAWGIRVDRVEIRDVQLPEGMQRAMAKQAEAERERRSKIIAAEGELQASEMLSKAATMMASAPGAMHLRTLQTLAEVAVEKNSTLVFPIPVEIMDTIQNIGRRALSEAGSPSAANVPKSSSVPPTPVFAPPAQPPTQPHLAQPHLAQPHLAQPPAQPHQ